MNTLLKKFTCPKCDKYHSHWTYSDQGMQCQICDHIMKPDEIIGRDT